MTQHLSRRLFIAGSVASFATQGRARARAYTLNAQNSRITFTFNASGTRQSGWLAVETADITVDISNLARSKATVTADIRKIRSNLALITQAIKSPELLDAANHPIVQFQSTAVRLGSSGRISEGAALDGRLTMRGVTQPLSLNATLSRPAGTSPDDLSVLYIQLSGTLNRRDYGANGYAGLADNEVALNIRAEIQALD